MTWTLVTQLLNDIGDVSEGHIEDAFGLLIEILCLLVMAYLFWEFVSMLFLVLVKRSRAAQIHDD